MVASILGASPRNFYAEVMEKGTKVWGNFTRLFVIVPWLIGLTRLSFAQSPTADDFNPGAGGDSPDWTLAQQPDGKILAGTWLSIGNLVRLNTDGTVDSGFRPVIYGLGIPETTIYSTAVQPDGKIVIGGAFAFVSGQPRTNIARLNLDGTLDMSFYPAAAGESWGFVHSVVLEDNGKIVLAGAFGKLNGEPRYYIGRLNADGTLDTAFNPTNTGLPAIQSDGKILLWRVRLNPDGTLDTAFNPANTGRLAIQSDGKIVIATTNTILRLNGDGSLDPSFSASKFEGAGSSSPFVESLALQADGKIVMAGLFYYVAGQPRSMIARLNADGTLDNSFNPGANGPVRALLVQPDGKIVAGGQFSTLGGQPRRGLGRLNSTGSATQSLSHDGSTITWLRGGTSPEVSHTTFDFSADGADWVSAGVGSSIPGGWQVAGLSIPANARVRARGFITGGGFGNSSWFVETISTPARVSLQFNADNVDLSWSLSLSNLDLFATGSLAPPVNWQRVSSPRDTNGSIIQAYVPRTNGAAFFQLRPSP